MKALVLAGGLPQIELLKQLRARGIQTVLADGTIQTVFTYDGARFCIEARVDAVQENNASDAILSAWGREVSAGGGLSLR